MHARADHQHPRLQTRRHNNIVAVGVAIWISCDLTAMLALSNTHTAVVLPSCRKAVVGSLMTGVPTAPTASGTT